MKRSRLWLALTLIGLGLLLSDARSVQNEPNSKRPSANAKEHSQEHPTYSYVITTPNHHGESATNKGSSATYNYYGRFNYNSTNVAPSAFWTAVWYISLVASIISGLAVAIFTGFLVWTSTKQWQVANAALKASQAVQRPLLGVSNGSLEAVEKSGSVEIAMVTGFPNPERYAKIYDITIEFTLKNPTNATAIIERAQARPHFSREWLASVGTHIVETLPQFRSVQIGLVDKIIGPMSETRAFVFVYYIPSGNWTEIFLKYARLRLFCSIQYRDVFENRFKERFWLSYEPPTLDFETSKMKPAFVWVSQEQRHYRKKKAAPKNTDLSKQK